MCVTLSRLWHSMVIRDSESRASRPALSGSHTVRHTTAQPCGPHPMAGRAKDSSHCPPASSSNCTLAWTAENAVFCCNVPAGPRFSACNCITEGPQCAMPSERWKLSPHPVLVRGAYPWGRAAPCPAAPCSRTESLSPKLRLKESAGRLCVGQERAPSSATPLTQKDSSVAHSWSTPASSFLSVPCGKGSWD